MRGLRRLAWIGGGAAALFAMAAATMMLAGDRIAASVIERRGAAALGRPLQFAGVELTWGSPLLVSARDVQVPDADAGAPPIFTAERVEATLDVRSLLQFELDVRSLRAERPSLRLEIGEDGRPNWEGMFPGDGSKLGRLADLALREGRVQFRNHATGDAADVVLDEVARAEPGTPIRLAAGGTFGEEAFSLKGEVTLASDAGGGPVQVRIEGHLGGNVASAEGRLADLSTLRGLDLHIDMVGDDLQRLLALLGVPIPRMPIYALAGRVLRDGTRWRVEGMSGRVGGSHLAGDVAVEERTADRPPYIHAALVAKQLDLYDLKGFYGGEPNRPAPRGAPKKPPPDPTRRVIPKTELPVEDLQRFDADVSLETERVKPPLGLDIDSLAFKLVVHRGTITFEKLRLGAGGGEAAGRIEIRSRQSPPAFEAAIDLARVDLRRLFARAEVARGVKQLAGSFGGAARLRSTGTTQREILSNLAGEARFSLRDGRLGNVAAGFMEADFLEALERLLGGDPSRSSSPANQAQPIRCLVARFDVVGGVATAAPLVVELPETVITGRGNINLGDETLFLDVRPYAKKGSSRPVGIPFRVGGTFARPDITTDKPGFGARVGAALGLDTVEIPVEARPFLEARAGEGRDCTMAAGSPGQGSSAPR